MLCSHSASSLDILLYFLTLSYQKSSMDVQHSFISQFLFNFMTYENKMMKHILDIIFTANQNQKEEITRKSSLQCITSCQPNTVLAGNVICNRHQTSIEVFWHTEHSTSGIFPMPNCAKTYKLACQGSGYLSGAEKYVSKKLKHFVF